ncbi:MAG: 30S ribosomal protein S16 [Chloroflexota bacterium]
MAVKIRLRRMGAKKQPSYRLVAADEQAPRDGRFIEIVGNYNPLTNPPTINVKEDRVIYWLSQGAKPSDAAARVLAKTPVMQHWTEQKTGQKEASEG